MLLSHRRKLNSTILCIGLLLVVLSSCTVRPRSVLSPKAMTDVLYDLHSAEGVLQAAGYNMGKDEELNAYYETILMNHHITQAQFDSSLVWYTDNPKQFCIVYGKVVQRLKEDRDAALEESAEISRRFLAERDMKNPAVTADLSLYHGHPVLSYIILPEPYTDYSIKEQPLDTTFRYIAFPDMQDSVSVYVDSVAMVANIKNALSKSVSSENTADFRKEQKVQSHSFFKGHKRQLVTPAEVKNE